MDNIISKHFTPYYSFKRNFSDYFFKRTLQVSVWCVLETSYVVYIVQQHGGQGFTINSVSQSEHFNFVTFDMYFYFHTYM